MGKVNGVTAVHTRQHEQLQVSGALSIAKAEKMVTLLFGPCIGGLEIEHRISVDHVSVQGRSSKIAKQHNNRSTV